MLNLSKYLYNQKQTNNTKMTNSVAGFIGITPLNTEISRHGKQVLTGRTTGEHNASMAHWLAES